MSLNQTDANKRVNPRKFGFKKYALKTRLNKLTENLLRKKEYVVKKHRDV